MFLLFKCLGQRALFERRFEIGHVWENEDPQHEQPLNTYIHSVVLQVGGVRQDGKLSKHVLSKIAHCLVWILHRNLQYVKYNYVPGKLIEGFPVN